MFKKSLFAIIIFIVSYQFYIFYLDKNIDDKLDDEQYEQDEKEYSEYPEERKPMVYETPQSFVHPVLGKPTKIIPEGYLFLIKNPEPWNAVVFNQGKEQPYLFIIKLPSKLGDVSKIIKQWTQVVKGIQLNEENELIIPSVDENSALAILNLLLNNIKGDLSFKNIVGNNLIGVSIAKIKKFSSIRSKILEQIIDSLSNGHSNGQESVEYQEDLAETIEPDEEITHNYKKEHQQDNSNIVEELAEVNNIMPKYNGAGPIAYEGSEFSYL